MINARNGRNAALTRWATAAAIGLAASSTAAAAPLKPYTQTTSAGRAIVLDQEGRRIAVPRAGRELPDGKAPAFTAHRLGSRDDVPSGVPSVASASGRSAIGPLRLDEAAIRSLNAGLAVSDRVAVLAPRQAFLVERAAGAELTDASTQFWRASMAAQAGSKSVGDAIEGWYDSSTNAVKKLNDQIADAFKRAFTPEAPKPVIMGGNRAAAQELTVGELPKLETPVAHEMSTTAADAQAAPVPEPAAWLVFAAAATLGLKLRNRKAE